MKKFIGTVAVAIALATPAVAQNPVTPALGCTSAYVVEEGDTLWDLAELKLSNPSLWGWLVTQNPVLQEPGRQSINEDGKQVVRIYPGESLYCLEDVLAQLQEQIPTDPRLSTSITEIQYPPVETASNNIFADWWWLWLLALIALAAVGWWFWNFRESHKDPVRSGPPQVNGGVNTVEEAREHFETRYRHFTVVSVTPGTIHGTMMVRYGDGTVRPRFMNGERGYQATIRNPDGTLETVYMLQACGNDLRFGGVARYMHGPHFRFIPDEAEVQPAAMQEPAPTEVEETSEGEIKIEVKPADQPGGTALVRVTGVAPTGMTLLVGPKTLTLRYVPQEE